MSTLTKSFPLRVLLTVTTERLLTEPKDGGNGIESLCEILGWMTDDSPFTHQLPRFNSECKPWLLKWFPELGPCSTQKSEESLDRWLESDRTETKQEGVKMWLTELKMMLPNLKDNYDVPKIHVGDHKRIEPVKELIEMRESKDGIIVI